MPTSRSLLLFTAVVLLAGCVSRPELVARDAIVPPGTDLSGHWQLRGDEGLDALRHADPGIDLRKRKRHSRDDSSAVRVFLESGVTLKVTQTAHGLFISFDRAVVEEYTFGEKRMVSVGPIEAQRVSGWEAGSFVVETLDADGALLTETWRLGENRATLIRDVSVVRGEREQFALRQVFDRI